MQTTPFVLGIVGGSGSGKSTVAGAVASLLGVQHTSELRLDDYHRFTRAERAERGVTSLNPVVHDLGLMAEHLQLLRQGRPIRNRSYDHTDGTFGSLRTIEPSEVVLVRGLLGYPTEDLRRLYHLAVFLHPEPELLFRWKLRRDVLSRGYDEAEVLKRIAQHLLDAKEFVDPQAERADVVVRYRLPDVDAPDSRVRTTVVLRRGAAELARTDDLLAGLGDWVRQEGDEEVTVEVAEGLPREAVEVWVAGAFPGTSRLARLGLYEGEQGQELYRAPLALVEGLIALLTERMRARIPVSLP